MDIYIGRYEVTIGRGLQSEGVKMFTKQLSGMSKILCDVLSMR